MPTVTIPSSNVICAFENKYYCWDRHSLSPPQCKWNQSSDSTVLAKLSWPPEKVATRKPLPSHTLYCLGSRPLRKTSNAFRASVYLPLWTGKRMLYALEWWVPATSSNRSQWITFLKGNFPLAQDVKGLLYYFSCWLQLMGRISKKGYWISM